MRASQHEGNGPIRATPDAVAIDSPSVESPLRPGPTASRSSAMKATSKMKEPEPKRNGANRRRPPPPPLGNQRALGNDGGRPTDYRPEYCEQARKLCQFGATLAEVAHFFDVTVPTICSWQKTYPEFFNAMKLGRQASDERVERSFYQRAIGYDVKTTRTVSKTGDGSVTETIEHLPGDRDRPNEVVVHSSSQAVERQST